MHHTATPSRAAGIIIHDNQLLVIYRKKNDSQYYTFPGGTVEDCESTEGCALREIVEETSIHTELQQLAYQVAIHSNSGIKIEYFYVAKYISGTPKLQQDSVEAARSSNNNIYRPMWMPLDKLQDIPLYPIEIRDRLIQDLQNGFSKETYVLSLNTTDMKN